MLTNLLVSIKKLGEAMEMQIIVIFCVVDDFIKAINHRDNQQSQLSSAEIITIVIVAGMFFGGNHEKTRRFFQDYRLVKTVLSKSQFNRRLHAIDSNLFEQLFYILSQVFKTTDLTKKYVVDSFPIQACHNIRISRSKIYRKKKEYRGYSASKRQFFFGIRVHMISTIEGKPIQFILAPGSIHDSLVFKQFDFDLPGGVDLFGDAAYIDYEHEDLVKEALDINLLIARKTNSKHQHLPGIDYLISIYRKAIETTFSKISTLLPKKIHAISAKGFELKVICFIFAYCFSFL